MKPHAPDPVSLISGLMFLLVAGGFAVSNTTDVNLRWLLLIPVVLIVAGAGALASVARRMSHRKADDPDLIADPM